MNYISYNLYREIIAKKKLRETVHISFSLATISALFTIYDQIEKEITFTCKGSVLIVNFYPRNKIMPFTITLLMCVKH
jgi:hypothetical protein